MRTQWCVVGMVCVVALRGAVGDAPATDPAAAFQLSVYATGLDQPDGLALHPESGELYVSEERAGRISVIRNGRPEPVITSGFRVRDNLSAESIDSEHPRNYWLAGQLNNPEGLAFGPDHKLYVIEDTARGRLLEFDLTRGVSAASASVVPLPRLGEPYAWESVCFSRDGQLFVAGSSYEATRSWGYSCVITRDTTQGWWMVDYGPLAAFSALTLMEKDQVLVAGDESVGSLTWWDVARKQEVQTLTHGWGAIEGMCALPDGSIAVAIEHSEHGGRILRINPVNGATTVLAEGLGQLESLVCDEKTGKIYCAEDSKGRILCLTPTRPIAGDASLLRVARRGSDAKRGLPAHQAPPFLKQFMSRVGVDLVDAGGPGNAGSGPAGTTSGNNAMTMEELGQRIPMIAGRVQVEPMPEVADPITEVHFLSLYPNQYSDNREQPAPPLCLYAARRRSGQVDLSQRVGGLQVRKYSPVTGWERVSQQAEWVLPLNTCSTAETSNGVTVVMTFLGLNKYEDCILTINYGQSNNAYFAVSGDKLRVAQASFMEQAADGTEVCNFALTGVRTRKAEDATWMPLGPRANWTLISPGFDNWVSRRTMAVMPDLVNQLRRYDRYIRDTLLADVPGASVPAMADHQGDRASDPEEPAPAPGNQVEATPPRAIPPVADVPTTRPAENDEPNITNMILRQIVRAWHKSWSGNN